MYLIKKKQTDLRTGVVIKNVIYSDGNSVFMN